MTHPWRGFVLDLYLVVGLVLLLAAALESCGLQSSASRAPSSLQSPVANSH